MKELVLAAFAAMLVPTLVSAQGTVNFGSVPTTDPQGPYQKVVVSATGLAVAGTTAQLWWAPSQNGTYTPITGLVPTSASSGRITAGSVVATTGAGTPGGADAWFYVYGENLGLNLNGRTPGFLSATANGSIIPPPIPPFLKGPSTDPLKLSGWNVDIGPVAMVIVPEPSTIALAGLGLASLLIFRRRK